jgi:hypothetical protein
MTYENADNTIAMGDHADHIHVGWRPLYGQSKKAARRIDARSATSARMDRRSGST